MVWASDDQELFKKTLNFPLVPSSAEVRLTQEDLWVYAALLHIVRKVNEGHYVAKIPKISSIRIGKTAAQESEAGMASNHIFHLQAAAGGEAAVASAATPGGETGPKPLDENRYVGADGKPLAGGATANDLFKRMPVSLHLTIDQREINKLLVECANSPLPVEVRQLRIAPGGGSHKTTAPGAAAEQKDAKMMSDSFDVPIELHGIIYIFNPPDPAKLGGEAPAAAGPGTPAPPPTG